jgi:hypothetical protein
MASLLDFGALGSKANPFLVDDSMHRRNGSLRGHERRREQDFIDAMDSGCFCDHICLRLRLRLDRYSLARKNILRQHE